MTAHLRSPRELSDFKQSEHEICLYLTDYRSLYVAHVGEITADDPRDDDDELHIPPIYRPKDIHCDCWFRIWDIRRLVSDDTLAVVTELRKLRNTAYHDKSGFSIWRDGQPSIDRHATGW